MRNYKDFITVHGEQPKSKVFEYTQQDTFVMIGLLIRDTLEHDCAITTLPHKDVCYGINFDKMNEFVDSLVEGKLPDRDKLNLKYKGE